MIITKTQLKLYVCIYRHVPHLIGYKIPFSPPLQHFNISEIGLNLIIDGIL